MTPGTDRDRAYPFQRTPRPAIPSMINPCESFRCRDTAKDTVKEPSRHRRPRTRRRSGSMGALERARRGAGDRVAVVARLAGGNALGHVAGIEGAVVPHRADWGRAGDVLLLVAGGRHESKHDDCKEAHGIAL